MFTDLERQQRRALIRARLGRASSRPAQAAIVTKAELEQTKALTTSQLRYLAAEQLTKANLLFEKLSGNVPWTKALVVQFADYQRWRPYAQQIQDASDLLTKGDAETADADKRTRFTSSWVTARQAVAGMAEESKLGETDYLMTYSDALEYAVGKSNLDAAKKAVSNAGSTLESLAKVAGILGGLYVVAQLVRR